jgi:hypothetical protein
VVGQAGFSPQPLPRRAVSQSLKVTAPLKTFRLNGHVRQYVDLTLSFGEYRKFFKPFHFNALKGEGEQRNLDPRHARKLAAEMLTGRYTPASAGACLRTRQRKDLLTVKGETATLTLREDDPVPETDGQHRAEAEAYLLTSHPELEAEINALPVDVKVMLDGSPKADFLRLQMGKPVDKAHLFSLRVKAECPGPDHDLAWKVAKELLTRQDSPFFNLIRMDSRAGTGLAVNTLCAGGTTDLSTSLLGLSRLCLAAGRDELWGANCVISAVKALRQKCPAVLEAGKVLTPPPNGTRGSATMLVGLGVSVAHWLIARGEDLPGDELEEELARAAQAALDKEVGLTRDTQLSAQAKRSLMQEFCSYLFEGWPECEEGVPAALLSALSPSAYGVKRKKAEKVA